MNFLARPIASREPPHTSDRPVSLCGVPASVFEALDLAPVFGCDSIFGPDSQRWTPRLHYRQAGNVNRASPPYGFRTFVVEGHSWRRDSWRRR
jgi:hypothetical protein